MNAKIKRAVKLSTRVLSMLMVIALAASVMPMSVFTRLGGGVAFADTFPDKDYFYIKNLGDWFAIHCSVADSGLMFRKSGDDKWTAFTNTGNGSGTYDGRVEMGTGDVVYFKASSKIDTLNKNPEGTPVVFMMSGVLDGTYAVGGNIMSLLDPDFTASSKLDPEKSAYAFARLFDNGFYAEDPLPGGGTILWHSNAIVADASDLRLPSNTAPHCYDSMFKSNYYYGSAVGLSAAPYLPAAELTDGCYDSMFSYCRSLSSVKVAFEDWKDGSCTNEWLSGVASSGWLYCSDALVSKALKRNMSYIPNGWNGGTNYVAPDYYLSIDSDSVQLKAYASAPLPESISVFDSNGTAVNSSYINGLTFNYPNTSKVISGRTVYGDLYRITFTVEGKTFNMRANVRTVIEKSVNDFSPIDSALYSITYIQETLDQMKAEVDIEFVDADLSGVEIVADQKAMIGPMASMGPMSMALPRKLYDDSTALAAQADTYKNGTKTQAEMNAYAQQLQTASDKLWANFDCNYVSVDGNTVSCMVSATYAKGLFKNSDECKSAQTADYEFNLEDGVYSFFYSFALDKYSKANFDKYVIVGSDPVAVLKAQFGSQYDAINSLSDVQEIVDYIFEAREEQGEDKPSGGGGQSSGGQQTEPAPDFTVTANEDGTFTWSVSDSVRLVGLAYAMDVPAGSEDAAEYYPLSIFGDINSVAAMANGVHTFRVTLRKGGSYVTQYYRAAASGCNTPAVVVFSSAVGVFPRGCDLDAIAYASGRYPDLEAALSENNVYYAIVKEDGAILDKALFTSGNTTFIFKYTEGETITIPVTIN